MHTYIVKIIDTFGRYFGHIIIAEFCVEEVLQKWGLVWDLEL